MKWHFQFTPHDTHDWDAQSWPVLIDMEWNGKMRKVVLHGRSSADTSVRDIMTAGVITVGPNHTVEHCMQLVTDHRIRHLPVLEDGEVIGVISIGDLVKAVIEDQKIQLDQLQRYIAS